MSRITTLRRVAVLDDLVDVRLSVEQVPVTIQDDREFKFRVGNVSAYLTYNELQGFLDQVKEDLL